MLKFVYDIGSWTCKVFVNSRNLIFVKNSVLISIYQRPSDSIKSNAKQYWARNRDQRDQMGRFLKVLSQNISSKSSPNYLQLFGLSWKTSLLNLCCYFLGKFYKHLGHFLLQHLVTLIETHAEVIKTRRLWLVGSWYDGWSIAGFSCSAVTQVFR